MVDYSHLSFQIASKVLLEVDVLKVLALFIKKLDSTTSDRRMILS